VALPIPIQPYVDRVGGTKRAMILLVGLGAAALIFGLARWASAPTWVPAFANVPLENVSEMTDKLTQAGVRFQLEQGGAQILVPASELAKARVTLARAGLPQAGRPGLELFDQPSWGMTDFTQRINYRRALEGELERTMSKMRGIENAKVHLVMHEAETFGSADRPTEASVVLTLKSGERPAGDVVKGIAHLVASSVEGLTSDHVTVVDDGGRLLSQADEPQSIEGLSSRQLEQQREVESYLRAKAEQLIAPIVGPGARVQVAASLNFDRVERTSSSVDPDRQVVAQEQKAEIVPGAQGGAASSNTATTYENTKTTESYASAIGGIRRLTVAVLVGDRPAATPKGAPQPRSAQELQQIESLVSGAIGADSARGDVVTVVSTPMGAPVVAAAAPAPKPSTMTMLQEHSRPISGIGGALMAFVLAFLTIRSLRSQPSALAAAGGPSALQAGSAAPGAAKPLIGFTPEQMEPLLIASDPVRMRASATVESKPDVAAKVLRAWLREG
jgi:flagellar M-ring protein FliF